MPENIEALTEGKGRQRRALPEPLIYRERDLDAVTRMSRKAREDAMKAGTFPKAVPLSAKARGWLVSEVHDWLAGRVAIRDNSGSTAA